MVAILMLALAITIQDSPDRPVRTTEHKMLSFIDAGLSHRDVPPTRRDAERS